LKRIGRERKGKGREEKGKGMAEGRGRGRGEGPNQVSREIDAPVQIPVLRKLKVNKAYSILGFIKRNFVHTGKESFVLLYKSMVRSHLQFTCKLR